MIERSEQLSPREWAEHNNAKEILESQMAHAKEMKHLEASSKIEEIKARLEAGNADRTFKERQMNREIQLATLEAKWANWSKIPLFILMLPVRVLFVIPLTVYAFTHQEVPEFYQRLFR